MADDDNRCPQRELDEFISKVTNYLSGSNIIPNSISEKHITKVKEILNYDDSRIREMTPLECLSDHMMILSYMRSIKFLLASEKSILNYGQDKLDRIIAHQNHKFDKFIKYEIKKYSIINNTEYAKLLNDIIELAKAKIEYLSNEVWCCEKIAMTLYECYKRKGYNNV